MKLRDPEQARRLLAMRRARKAAPDTGTALTAEWFPEARAFFDEESQLAAALDSRRAGKTRGLCRDFIRDLISTPGFRGLYINSTRNEAERLAWYGNRNDGMAALVEQYKLKIKADQSDLTLYMPSTDGWIYLRGADDEAELRKALGGAYHKVYWDEAQKIPPKLAQPIREVFMPALLDFGGKFRLTGTPVRQMSGLFYDVTRPDDKRLPGWKVHRWTLLANPYFGRAKLIRGRWFVVWRENDSIVSGPHTEEQLPAAIAGARWTNGVFGLQKLLGGEKAAPIDSPIMQREAFGRWVHEDAAYVYVVHKVPQAELFYAPARLRADGFPDIPLCLEDLPFPWREAQLAMGVDIGFYPDPFAFVVWAWHERDPKLYELCSWRQNYLTSDQQNDVIKAVRAHVNVGLIVADASNPAKPTVVGWSLEWVERYNQPILEAEKAQKHTAIDTENADILARNIQLRDGGALYEEMSQLQWSSIVSATGKLIEDPTLANDCCDAGLYAHRHSYQYRWRPEAKRPTPRTQEAYEQEERELEEAQCDEEDTDHAHY
ncbi:MAG: terminase large subunit domain-containing protein [Tepidisphaeraceae bacterium]